VWCLRGGGVVESGRGTGLSATTSVTGVSQRRVANGAVRVHDVSAALVTFHTADTPGTAGAVARRDTTAVRHPGGWVSGQARAQWVGARH